MHKAFQKNDRILKVYSIYPISCKKSCRSKIKQQKLWVVMDYGELSLDALIKERTRKRQPFKTYEIFEIFEQLSDILSEIEVENVIAQQSLIPVAHFNVKPENIFITDREALTLKLADVNEPYYHLSFDYHRKNKNYDKLFYTPIERFNTELGESNISKKMIYSLGMVILKMCFPSLTGDIIYERFLNSKAPDEFF